MALVNRWYRILESLVARHVITLEEMRSNLNVSMSTLQKSIEQLNEILDSDIQIKQVGNTLRLEVYDYSRLEEVLSGSLRKESDFNSSSKRSSYLVKRLVRTSEPLLIDDLAEEIGVSRTTINKDLRNVKDLAKGYQVNIVGKPNRGLEVIGSELNLRLFYIHHVYSYFDSDSLKKETHIFLEKLYQTYRIPKKTQELLTKVISITVSRLSRKKQLDTSIKYYSNELPDSDIIGQLIYHLEVTYQISLSQYEQDFISFPLNTQYIDGLSYKATQSKELQLLFKSMVQKIQNTLLLSFDEERLYLEIYTHLKFLLNRLIFHVQAKDIFHGDIPSKYPLAFEMARVAGQELQSKFGYELELSELSYLALYFEMILREESFEGDRKNRKIAVVCTTGRGTANMICRQLKRVLGQDIEIKQYSEEEFNPNRDDDYFAVFTTIPLKLVSLKSPVIQITNLFDDQWLRDEWQRVNCYHQKHLETILLKFLYLPQQASYQDYLIRMVDLLEEEDLVDSGFRERTLEREKQESTIFGNGIGFPHTINQVGNKTILMLGVLDETHCEKGEVVDLIFLVAIPPKIEDKMETELLELYDDIFRIAGDKNLKEALTSIRTEADFIDLTRNKGVF